MLPCELVVNWLRLILIDVYCILYVYDVPSFHSTHLKRCSYHFHPELREK